METLDTDSVCEQLSGQLLGLDATTADDALSRWVAMGVDLDLHHPRFPCPSDFDKGTTPLVCACEHRRLDLVRALLRAGADPNRRDVGGFYPLESAVLGRGDGAPIDDAEEIVAELVLAGAREELHDYVRATIAQRGPLSSPIMLALVERCAWLPDEDVPPPVAAELE